MIAIDTAALALGFCSGALLSGLFFASLAFSVRIALRSSRPVIVLLLSSACRISLLLAAGYYLAITHGNAWSLVGFVVAFFLVRLLATSWAPAAAVCTSRVEEVG
tara:strand:- start:108813 stop:109127 length:315 start_codon:yes stop_codon:yes gene_type:complete